MVLLVSKAFSLVCSISIRQHDMRFVVGFTVQLVRVCVKAKKLLGSISMLRPMANVTCRPAA